MGQASAAGARIGAAFARARAERRVALVPYVMSGYPDRATSEELVLALAAAGADVIELGMPFSDPLADGATIQHAGQVALERGATLGANCTIVCGHTIGRYAFIGAGTVVIRDVPDYALVVGNPGRIAGWVCRCGVKLASGASAPARATCTACATVYIGTDTKGLVSLDDSVNAESRAGTR